MVNVTHITRGKTKYMNCAKTKRKRETKTQTKTMIENNKLSHVVNVTHMKWWKMKYKD